MQNKLPDFIDKHKICIICEGNEEYEYLKKNIVYFDICFISH